MASILKRVVLILTTLCIVAGSADTSAAYFYHSQVGISLGFPIATGLSYRTWLSEKYGIQFSGLYFTYNTEYRGYVTGTHNFQVLSFGAMGLYNFSEWKRGRFFGYTGIGYVSAGSVNNQKIMIDSVFYDYDMSDRVDKTIPLCAGLGIDCKLSHINLDVMLGTGIGYSVSDKYLYLPVPMIALGISYCY